MTQQQLNIYEVIDVLRKQPKCYLWDKQYNQWEEDDFKCLQTIVDNTYDGKIKTKKRKTITILSPDKEFYTFTTYKEAATFLKVKLPVISIAVKKGYNINGHKIV